MTKHGTSCDVEKATKEAGMQVPGGACIRAEGQVPGGAGIRAEGQVPGG